MGKLKPIEETGLWKVIVHFMEIMLFLMSAALASMVFITVPVRYIMKSSIFGIEEVIMMMAIWIYYLGGAYGSYEQSHINADILLHFVKNKKAIKVISVLKQIVAIVVFGAFGYWCIAKYLAWTIQSGGQSMQLHIPNWVPISMMAISFVLMTLYELFHLYRIFKPYKPSGDKAPEAEGEEVSAA
jgi:TRAP-type C4-dicarboxylate transport system permease small subunit